MRLYDEIQALKAQMMQQIPKEALAVMEQAMEELARSGIVDHSLKAGDQAPDFTLPDTHGDNIRLTDTLGQGPVVLSFYRGGWCPYCNLELHALQQALPRIQKLHAQLIAVSPESPDHSLSTVEKQDLEFEVLNDQGNMVARKFGLVFALPEALRPLYESFGIDLPAWNGDDSFELPMPATYVIDTDARILDAFVDTDYTQRMEPERVLDVLASHRA